MKKTNLKTKISIILSILMLTFMFNLVVLQSATAQEIREKTTYAYIGRHTRYRWYQSANPFTLGNI